MRTVLAHGRPYARNQLHSLWLLVFSPLVVFPVPQRLHSCLAPLVVPIEFIELGFQLGKLALQAKQVPRSEAVESLEDHGCPIPIARHKGSKRRKAIDIYRLHFLQVTTMVAENRLSQFRWVRWSTEP